MNNQILIYINLYTSSSVESATVQKCTVIVDSR
jgi:hypothetical protein